MIPPTFALALEDTTLQLVHAEHERDTYRELLGLTLAQLHESRRENRRLQTRLYQFLNKEPLGYLDEQQRGYAA